MFHVWNIYLHLPSIHEVNIPYIRRIWDFGWWTYDQTTTTKLLEKLEENLEVDIPKRSMGLARWVFFSSNVKLSMWTTGLYILT